MIRVLVALLSSANVLLAGLIACGNPRAQHPNLTGRWIIELKFDEGRSHTIQFDAHASGTGTLLLLDRTSNMNQIDPKPAVWSADVKGSLTEVHISGEIEFPLGNVGRLVGPLTLVGTLEQRDTISGTATFVHIAPSQPARKGSFVARRDLANPASSEPAPSVTLLSFNSGEALSRKKKATIKWSIHAPAAIVSQQIFLSVDHGQSFIAITPLLDGHQRSFSWRVPGSVGKTRDALMKIVITDERGHQGEDVTDRTFQIK